LFVDVKVNIIIVKAIFILLMVIIKSNFVLLVDNSQDLNRFLNESLDKYTH